MIQRNAAKRYEQEADNLLKSVDEKNYKASYKLTILNSAIKKYEEAIRLSSSRNKTTICNIHLSLLNCYLQLMELSGSDSTLYAKLILEKIEKDIDIKLIKDEFDEFDVYGYQFKAAIKINDKKTAFDAAKKIDFLHPKLVKDHQEKFVDKYGEGYFANYNNDYNEANAYLLQYHSQGSSSKNIKRKLIKEEITINKRRKKTDESSAEATNAKMEEDDINGEPFCLKQVSAEEIAFTIKKRVIHKYDLSKEKDINRLEKDKRKENKTYQYDREYNAKRRDVKLIVAPVYVIHNQYGIFANQNIEPDTILGCYAGPRFKVGENYNKDSKFLFNVTNAKKEVISIIDGENGDYTALFNSSEYTNATAKQEKIDDTQEICIITKDFIPKGQQIIISYGDGYYPFVDYKQLYQHPSDNELSPEEIYELPENKLFYAQGTYRFDEATCKALKLPSEFALVPQMFLHIYRNDNKALTKILKGKSPVDLLSFSCDENGKINEKQQHITALMLACYWGREDCIYTLLEQGADSSRCTLVDGYNSFVLLMKGFADKYLAEKIGHQLLDEMKLPFTIDADGLSLLHYAIERNIPSLVSKLLSIAKVEKFNFFSTMYRDNKITTHADIDYCLRNNQFEVAKILLLNIHKYELKENIKNGLIFSKSCLNVLSLEQLENLQQILNLYKIREGKLKHHKIFDNLKKLISSKTSYQGKNQMRLFSGVKTKLDRNAVYQVGRKSYLQK